MNPTLPTDYVTRMAEDDPEAYRSEVLGEFRAGVASLFDPEALEAIVMSGRRELPPDSALRYRAFADPSGGRGDAFTVAIGHVGAGRAVVDALRVWHPPFNPTSVVAELAALLSTYRVAEVTGDRYGGDWPREAFRSHGITYEGAEMSKSDLYLGMLPRVNAGTRAVVTPAVPQSAERVDRGAGPPSFCPLTQETRRYVWRRYGASRGSTLRCYSCHLEAHPSWSLPENGRIDSTGTTLDFFG